MKVGLGAADQGADVGQEQAVSVQTGGTASVVSEGESGVLSSSFHPCELLCVLQNPKYVIPSEAFLLSLRVCSLWAPEAICTSVTARHCAPSCSTFVQ